MPMTIISSADGGRINHLAAAWISRCNPSPPLLSVALGKSHFTNPIIRKNGEFGVSIPHTGMVGKVDHVGLVSGKNTDKSHEFEVFYGGLKNAPMVAGCRLALACRVVSIVDLPYDELFIAEIAEAYADESCLTGGKPDIKKIDPFVLSMPDNRYWRVGEFLADAWKVGKG
jgi:flavin reductase (DIM6/NTAB) family NADH-FMN oxidoreductase RutF